MRIYFGFGTLHLEACVWVYDMYMLVDMYICVFHFVHMYIYVHWQLTWSSWACLSLFGNICVLWSWVKHLIILLLSAEIICCFLQETLKKEYYSVNFRQIGLAFVVWQHSMQRYGRIKNWGYIQKETLSRPLFGQERFDVLHDKITFQRFSFYFILRVFTEVMTFLRYSDT